MKRTTSALESVQVGDRRFRDVRQRLAGQEALMSRNEHIGKGQQASKLLVSDRPVGAVLKKQIALALINIDRQTTEMLALQ